MAETGAQFRVGDRVSLEVWNARWAGSQYLVPSRATIISIDHAGDCELRFDDGTFDEFHASWFTRISPLELLAEVIDGST